MGGRGLGPLGARLAAAFVGVALAAVAVFAVVVLVADRNDLDHLGDAQRSQTTAAIAASVLHAYRTAGGWAVADLEPAAAVAGATGVGVEVHDTDGRLLLRTGPLGVPGATVMDEPLREGGQAVGSLRVAFPGGGLTAGERHLRSSLGAAVGWSALLAAGVGLVVAVLVARGLVRPIRRLSAAVRGFQLGGDPPGVGDHAGPGELGELGRAFDAMADSLQREDRLRRALAADVAHELRTPIAVLQAETEALVDGVTDASPAAMVSLHDEALRVGRMVDDLQSLASAEAAVLHLERRRIDLARVAAEAADSLASRFGAKGVSLEEQLSPAVVKGDPVRLHQVVSNLLGNAVKFTPPGGRVTLTVATDGGDAVVEVADTGPGVPEDERDRVWERFYRGAAGRAAGGSGIGLAVVKELIAAHGGTVALLCPAEGGAVFAIRLPLTE